MKLSSAFRAPVPALALAPAVVDHLAARAALLALGLAAVAARLVHLHGGRCHLRVGGRNNCAGVVFAGKTALDEMGRWRRGKRVMACGAQILQARRCMAPAGGLS